MCFASAKRKVFRTTFNVLLVLAPRTLILKHEVVFSFIFYGLKALKIKRVDIYDALNLLKVKYPIEEARELFINQKVKAEGIVDYKSMKTELSSLFTLKPIY